MSIKKKLLVVTASLASASMLIFAGLGVASAATNDTATIGSSGITRSVFKEESLGAAAQVLNTSTANVQAAHKNKTMSSLITNAGLTKKTFTQKFRSQLISDLESMGYTQDQITIALQHRTIVHLHHHNK